MCDQSFSKRTAFSYLEDLATQFNAEYGSKVQTVARPYSFIEFGNYSNWNFWLCKGIKYELVFKRFVYTENQETVLGLAKVEHEQDKHGAPGGAQNHGAEHWGRTSERRRSFK